MSDIKQEAVARLIGRLKYEPELRKTKNNKQFVNLTVESVGDDDGRDFKTSHKAILWGHDAEDFMASRPHKDDIVRVSGGLRNNNYENKDGQKVWQTQVVGKAVLLEKAAPAPASTESSSDDIPF